MPRKIKDNSLRTRTSPFISFSYLPLSFYLLFTHYKAYVFYLLIISLYLLLSTTDGFKTTLLFHKRLINQPRYIGYHTLRVLHIAARRLYEHSYSIMPAVGKHDKTHIIYALR